MSTMIVIHQHTKLRTTIRRYTDTSYCHTTCGTTQVNTQTAHLPPNREEVTTFTHKRKPGSDDIITFISPKSRTPDKRKDKTTRNLKHQSARRTQSRGLPHHPCKSNHCRPNPINKAHQMALTCEFDQKPQPNTSNDSKP